jgi:hypothetical protein
MPPPQPITTTPAPNLTPTHCTNTTPLPHHTTHPTGCLITTTPNDTAQTHPTNQATPLTEPAVFCDNNPANVWVFNRTSACIHDRTTTYLEQDPKTGATLGSAGLAITQLTQLNPQSAAWTETISLTMTSASGQVSQLNANLTGTCTPSCAASSGDAFGGNDTLTNGTTLTGTINLSDNPATGAEDLDEGQFVLHITQPGTVPTNPNVSFGDQVQIRCDDALTSDAVLDISNTTTQTLADPQTSPPAASILEQCPPSSYPSPPTAQPPPSRGHRSAATPTPGASIPPENH